MAFHNTLTSFLGVNATEYAPKHETSTEFMNAKFEEVLDNDKWLKENCMRTYKSLTEIDPSFTVNTPVKDVVLAMEDNSIATYDTSLTDAGVYPTVLGTINIFKQHSYRSYVQCTNPIGGFWHTSYHTHTNPDCEWTQLASEKKVYMSASMLKNGWTLKTDYDNSYVVTSKTVLLNLSVNGGTLTSNTIICEGLPIRNQNNNVPIILRGTNGASHIVFYTTDGKLTLSGDVSSIGSWGFINATINL